jgi:hypothetical protein
MIRRLAEAIKSQNWFIVFIEVLVLVVGIFIGLQVDDWNQLRKDRVEERVYLEELLEDFEANRTALLQSISDFEEIIPAMTRLLEQSAMDTPDWSIGELNDAFRKIHYMPTFFPVERAFTNLTGSGDLKLIRNRDLKNALAQYFSASKLVELVQNTHEMELVQTFQPYVIEHMDFQAVFYQRVEDFPLPSAVEESRLLEVLDTREFRNNLTQKWTICTDLLYQHRSMQVRTSEVIRILETEIGKTGGT